MDFIVGKKGLTIKVVSDGAKASLNGFTEDEIDTDNAMFEYFDDVFRNCEYEWITPEECGALTDAPIIGIKDEFDKVVEAYGFMDYAIESLLGQLKKYGEAFLQKG